MTRVAFPGATFEVNDRRVGEIYSQFPDIMATQLRNAFGRFGGAHRREVGSRLRGKPLRKLVQASGKNRNPSFFYRVRPKQKGTTAGEGFGFSKTFSLKEITLDIFSTSEVTALHETGGVVRPKNGRYLVIPVRSRKGGLATNASGGLAFNRGRLVEGRGGRKKRQNATPADYRDKGYSVFRRGDVLFVARKLKSGRISDKVRPIGILKRQVKIPARLGIIDTWNAQQADRQRKLNEAISTAIFLAARRRKGGRRALVA